MKGRPSWVIFTLLTMTLCGSAMGDVEKSITVIGTGISDPRLNNLTQEKATACEAALAQAQFKMYTLLKNHQGTPPTGQGIVKGAEIIRTDWSDGTCRVTVRVKS